MAAFVHVGIYFDNEIFARGVEACLRDEPDIDLVDLEGEHESPDLVVTTTVRMHTDWGCPILVCSDESVRPELLPKQVMGVVPMRTLTPAQLVPAVKAGAAGFRFAPTGGPSERIDGRGLDVLRLLSEGAGTREISSELGYSERTIKSVISDVLHNLDARSRAHAVALAVRQSLI